MRSAQRSGGTAGVEPFRTGKAAQRGNAAKRFARAAEFVHRHATGRGMRAEVVGYRLGKENGDGQKNGAADGERGKPRWQTHAADHRFAQIPTFAPHAAHSGIRADATM